jgi:hypothetical protein
MNVIHNLENSNHFVKDNSFMIANPEDMRQRNGSNLDNHIGTQNSTVNQQIMANQFDQLINFHIKEMINLKEKIFLESNQLKAKKYKNVILDTINFFKNKISLNCPDCNSDSSDMDNDSNDLFEYDNNEDCEFDGEVVSFNNSDDDCSNYSDSSDKSACYSDTDSEYNFDMDETYKTTLNNTMRQALDNFKHCHKSLNIQKIIIS